MRLLKTLIEKDKQLLQELFQSIDDAVQQKEKSLSRLRFARPTKNGWSFFKKKHVSWDLLDTITQQTVKRHSHCHKAQVADVLSHLVNLSDKEFSSLRLLL